MNTIWSPKNFKYRMQIMFDVWIVTLLYFSLMKTMLKCLKNPKKHYLKYSNIQTKYSNIRIMNMNNICF